MLIFAYNFVFQFLFESRKILMKPITQKMTDKSKHIYFTIEEAKPEKLTKRFLLRSKKTSKNHKSLNQSPQKTINEEKMQSFQKNQSLSTIKSLSHHKANAGVSSYLKYKEKQRLLKTIKNNPNKGSDLLPYSFRVKEIRDNPKNHERKTSDNCFDFDISSRPIHTSIKERKFRPSIFTVSSKQSTLFYNQRCYSKHFPLKKNSFGSGNYRKMQYLDEEKWQCARPWSPGLIEQTISPIQYQQEI